MKVGDLVKLKAKTRHGENRIRQHGDIWTVMLISPSHMKGQIFLSSQEETFAVKDLTLKERNLIIDILKAEDIHFETS